MVVRCRRCGKIIGEGEKYYASRIGSVVYCVSCRRVLVRIFGKKDFDKAFEKRGV
jgi:ribosomal protein S27E